MFPSLQEQLERRHHNIHGGGVHANPDEGEWLSNTNLICPFGFLSNGSKQLY